jgi:formylglycine-generating enzyme required for sulfatase activity
MGAPRREQGRRPNETERTVRLTRPFYISTREVTNREFREFKPNHTSGAEKYQQLAAGEHPAVMLSWADAAAYCNWLSDREGLPPAYAMREGALRLAEPLARGYRLPTEAEWEWASRYNGGGGARRYPWGDQMPPSERSGNFADQSAKGIVPNVLSAYDDGFPVTAPVGSFSPSPLGLYDLGGNVAEWVHDLYTVHSGTGEAAIDPTGPTTGQYHVIRGSSWRSASISELRFAYRDFGDQGRLDVGFRVARNAE